MSNIMINKVCNLACPYCFANDYVNVHDENFRVSSNMTVEDFKKAVIFLKKMGTDRLGILGGEPMLHPNFKEIVQIARDSLIPSVMLFTNAVYLDRHFDTIAGKPINLLINVNPEKDMGSKQFDRMYKNIVDLVKYSVKQPNVPANLPLVNHTGIVTLGINMYEPNFEYQQIIDLVKETGIRKIRTSIAVPNTEEKTDASTKDYFYNIKPRMLQFFRELKEIDAVPIFDCNIIPLCVLTPEEITFLDSFNLFDNGCGGKNRIKTTNLLDGSKCNPVIDILPDLSMIRCFGLSENLVQHLEDYENNPLDIVHFYRQKFDNLAYTIPTFEDCKTCPEALKQKCMGGCLAFKEKKYDQVHEMLEVIN